MEDNTQAFPVNYEEQIYEQGLKNGRILRAVKGMKLRDYFAGQVITQYIKHFENGDYSCKDIAESSYHIADAMLKERSK